MQASYFTLSHDAKIETNNIIVFPQVEVRVCQFYVMDAIQCWLNAAHPKPVSGTKKLKSKSRKTLIVPKEAHADIEGAFRFTQRCRDSQEFVSHLNSFEAAIQQICTTYKVPEQSDPICQYFADNIWSVDWRGI